MKKKKREKRKEISFVPETFNPSSFDLSSPAIV